MWEDDDISMEDKTKEVPPFGEKDSPAPDLGAQLEATADIIIETVLEMDRIPEKADTVQIMEILQAFIARNFGTKPDLGAMLERLKKHHEKGAPNWDYILGWNDALAAVEKALEEGE
jgi:hypothetical protein